MDVISLVEKVLKPNMKRDEGKFVLDNVK